MYGHSHLLAQAYKPVDVASEQVDVETVLSIVNKPADVRVAQAEI
ncbi:Unknown protein sequence [Pseudomonas amygdali pv. sesami]|nr:Unknown protein sequence [Pseudomonas amygdali pv. sesami]